MKKIVNNHKNLNHFEKSKLKCKKKKKKNLLSSFNETKCLDHDHCHFCVICANVVVCVLSIRFVSFSFVRSSGVRFVSFRLHYFKVNDNSII